MRFDPAHFARLLVRSMSDGLIYADADGLIRYWNEGARRIFGFDEAEALGQSLDIVIPEPLRERHWAGYARTMRTGESRYSAGALLAVPALRRDGTRVSIEFTIVPFQDPTGRMIGMAAVIRDVTERYAELKALREQVARLPQRA